jgi:hypothetical protein
MTAGSSTQALQAGAATRRIQKFNLRDGMHHTSIERVEFGAKKRRERQRAGGTGASLSQSAGVESAAQCLRAAASVNGAVLSGCRIAGRDPALRETEASHR